MIKDALNVIKDLVTKSKGGLYEPKHNSIMELAEYSNKLLTSLIHESLIAITILGLSLS